jgi:hypothetical protein
MSRYFFHVVDGKFNVDNVGTELGDMNAVRSEAIAAAGELLRDAGRQGWNGTEWQMHVTDSGNRTVLKLFFSAEQFD